MNTMIGVCGIDCEACDVYIATVTNDQQLREKTAKLWSELNQTEILPEYLYCMGCRSEGVKTFYCQEICQIRKCALQNRFSTCADCKKLDSCGTLKTITDHSPNAMEHLKEL